MLQCDDVHAYWTLQETCTVCKRRGGRPGEIWSYTITSAKKKPEKGQSLTSIHLSLVTAINANLQILQPYKKEFEGICQVCIYPLYVLASFPDPPKGSGYEVASLQEPGNEVTRQCLLDITSSIKHTLPDLLLGIYILQAIKDWRQWNLGIRLAQNVCAGKGDSRTVGGRSLPMQISLHS